METAFFQTAKLLQDQGHEVIFFSMTHPKNSESRFHLERHFLPSPHGEKRQRLYRELLGDGAGFSLLRRLSRRHKAGR
jgi:hypothetical protein